MWLLVFSIPGEDQFTIPFIGAVTRLFGLLAAGFGGLAIVLRWKLRGLAPAHYPILFFICWAALSRVWTFDADLTSTRITTLIQMAIMGWLIWELAPGCERQISLMKAYVCGTLFCSLTTFYNFLSGSTTSALRYGSEEAAERGFEGRYTAGINLNGPSATNADGHAASVGINENDIGLMLALSIPFSLYLVIQEKNNKKVLLYWFQIAASLGTIALTASRGAAIATCIALTLLPLTFRYLPKWRRSGYLLLGAVSLIGAFFVIPAASWSRLGTISSEIQSGTLTKRTVIWKAGLERFVEGPIQGVGAGAFSSAVQAKLDTPYAAHNSYLSVLVELGIVGAVIFAAILFSLVDAAFALPLIERRLWIVMLLTFMIGVFSLSWEHRKTTWFLFGLLPAQAALKGTRFGSKRMRQS